MHASSVLRRTGRIPVEVATAAAATILSKAFSPLSSSTLLERTSFASDALLCIPSVGTSAASHTAHPSQPSTEGLDRSKLPYTSSPANPPILVAIPSTSFRSSNAPAFFSTVHPSSSSSGSQCPSSQGRHHSSMPAVATASDVDAHAETLMHSASDGRTHVHSLLEGPMHHYREGPFAAHRRRVEAGLLRGGDLRQESAVLALQRLHDEIAALPEFFLATDDYYSSRAPLGNSESDSSIFRLWKSLAFQPSSTPSSASTSGAFRLRSGKALPRGLYMFGGVGTGKTMLMDMFFEDAPVLSRLKRRAHFHAFMLEVHGRMHQLVQEAKAQGIKGGDPIPRVAREVAAGARLLCFDELEVTDVADALLLRRLFDAMFAEGCVVVATSNRAPSELYKNGINRQLFLPFIALITEMCEVLDMREVVDYRSRGSTLPGFFVKLQEEDVLVTTAFNLLAPPPDRRGEEEEEEEKGVVLDVMMGRKLRVPRSKGDVCSFSFDKLCGTRSACGAADYLALVGRYKVLVLTDIPRLTREREGEARRFINLVDILYENNTLLLASSDCPLDELFDLGSEGAAKPGASDIASLGKDKAGGVEISVSDKGGAVGQAYTVINGVEWSGTGRKESLAEFAGYNFTAFAASRTVSRMGEMQTREYISRAPNGIGHRLLANLQH